MRLLGALPILAILLVRLAAIGEAIDWSRAWNDPRTVYARTLRTFPNAWNAHLLLARIHIERGAYEQAEALARTALPRLGKPDQAHAVLAVAALHQDRTEDALEHATAAMALRSENPWALGFRGFILAERLGNIAAAKSQYRRAVAIRPWDPDSVFAAGQLAYLLAVEGARAEAIALWQDALRFDPSNREFRQNLAVALHQEGHHAEARNHRVILDATR